jgi:hypothetical protein
LYRGKIKKKENINKLDKNNIMIKFKFFELLKETNKPKKENTLINIRGNKCAIL